MLSHHFSAFARVLEDRGGAPRDPGAARRWTWRLCRCLHWNKKHKSRNSKRFPCKSEWNLEILPKVCWPKGSREPCSHVCHWLILQAFPKMWGRGKKKNTTIKTQTKTCHWVPLQGSGKSSGKRLFFFPLLFSFSKCGKHDSVANNKLSTRSAAAVIGAHNHTEPCA